MPVTFATTIIHRTVMGNKRIVTADIVFTGTPTAAGDAYGASDVGLTGIDIILMDAQTVSSTADPVAAADVGYHCGYDYVNSKIIITEADGDSGAHVVSNDDVGGAKVRALIIGY